MHLYSYTGEILTSTFSPEVHFLQYGHTSYVFPSNSTNQGASIQVYEHMGAILIQITILIYFGKILTPK